MKIQREGSQTVKLGTVAPLWIALLALSLVLVVSSAKAQFIPFSMWQQQDTQTNVTWPDFLGYSESKTFSDISTSISVELSASYNVGTPTIEFQKNSEAWTAFTPGSPATENFNVDDTLRFRVVGNKFDSADITVTNTTTGSAVIDTLQGSSFSGFQMEVVTSNSGVSGSNQFQLPLVSGATYNFEVDWGDGSHDVITAFNDPEALHTYPSSGAYTINIRGTLERLYFNNGGDAAKLTDISSWGEISWSSMDSAFYGCSNLNVTASDAPDLSSVTELSSMFWGATSLVGTAAFNTWNTSNVTDFQDLFREASSFNQNIGSWDMSSTVHAHGMFREATSFNQDIGGWTFSTDLRGTGEMFRGATAFNQNINAWNVADATNMNQMFRDAVSFNQPLSSWDVSRNQRFNYMFKGATNFNQDISSWNTSSAITFENMFQDAVNFNQNIGSWDTSLVENMKQVFDGASAFNQPIGGWNTALVTTMERMFRDASVFNADCSGWNTTNVTNSTDFDQNASAWQAGNKPTF